MKIIGLIPARGGSKRVRKKNIKYLCGKPLIAYTIEAALESKKLDRIIVSTDDKEIKKISMQYGAEVPFLRPKSIAEDKSSDLEVLRHTLKYLSDNKYDMDAIAYLRPTTPLKTALVIDKAIEEYIFKKADVLRSLTPIEPINHPYWIFHRNHDGKVRNFMKGIKISKYYQSQLLPKAFRLSAVIDIYSKNSILTGNIYDNENTYSYIVKQENSFDIDTEYDFKLCEKILDSKI